MSDDAIRVLIIEDDLDYVDILRLCLDEPDAMGMSFVLEHADGLEAGLAALRADPPDAVLLDLVLPDSRGLETARRVLAENGTVPILAVTNLGDEETALAAVRLGAQDYLIKATSDSRMLKRAIWYAIERQKLLSQSESLIRAAADAMVVIDGSGAIQHANPAAEELLGAKAEDLVGHPFPYDAVSGETSRLRLPGPSGHKRTGEMRVTPIHWKGNRARLASIRDITGLLRVEQLAAEVRERRKLDRLKDEFIGTVSHELRTPLTLVKAAVDALHERGDPLPAPSRRILDLAQRNTLRLTRMINNLLDLTRLESGSVTARPDRLDIPAFVHEVLAAFRLRARRGSVSLHEEFEKGLPAAYGDPEMITQVLTNLVDNALRYARSKVVIRAAREEGGVRIEVVDDGPGIPREKIGELFNKFTQVNRPSEASGYKGTGLGLSICKEILRLHGTQPEVQSSRGEGTRFHFLLSFCPQTEAKEAPR